MPVTGVGQNGHSTPSPGKAIASTDATSGGFGMQNKIRDACDCTEPQMRSLKRLLLLTCIVMGVRAPLARANAPLLRAPPYPSLLRDSSMPDVLRIKARVSYTRKVDTGKIAGRTVDEQLWGRLRSAFAVQTISDEQVQTLQDQDDPREISAIDARTLPAPPTIKSHGFELRVVPSEITSWQQTPEVDAIGRREAEAIVLAATGADEVYAFDSTWRSSKRNNFD